MQIGGLRRLISQDSKIKFWILWIKKKFDLSQDFMETETMTHSEVGQD